MPSLVYVMLLGVYSDQSKPRVDKADGGDGIDNDLVLESKTHSRNDPTS